MKQRITIDQLNELTDTQKERLKIWWKPQISDTYAYSIHYKSDGYVGWLWNVVATKDDVEMIEGNKNKYLPLLSIEQMIELLYWEKDYPGMWFDKRYEVWKVEFYNETYEANELCDSLWSAVKDVLK